MYQRFHFFLKKGGMSVFSPTFQELLTPRPKAIIVGNTPDADLRRIVTATDGQCYQISHLGEGDLGLTWMSQEGSKWLVKGLQPTYKWGILGI